MSRWRSGVALVFTLLMLVGGGLAEAQDRVSVTARQLFDQGHRLEVLAGTEVVWADPHFERGFLFHADPRFPGSLTGSALAIVGSALMIVPLMYFVVKRLFGVGLRCERSSPFTSTPGWWARSSSSSTRATSSTTRSACS